MPEVSIIVPVYKVEDTLEQCVNSLLGQTLESIEIILVDDGSPDKCGVLCDLLSKKDDRIIVIHKKNGGLSDARNAGLDVAKGKYIGFVDSDDYVDPEMFNFLVEICEKYNLSIAGCDLKYVYEPDGDIVSDSDGSFSVLNSDDFFRKMLDTSRMLRIGVWNKIYRKELFDKVRFPKGKVFEDVGTMYKLIFATPYIGYASDAMYYYRKGREGAITAQKYGKNEYDRLEMNDNMINYIKLNRIEVLEDALIYRAINCDLSIYNSMISSQVKDKKMIDYLKRDLKIIKHNVNIFHISCLKFIQIQIASSSYYLYKFIYSLLFKRRFK